MNGFLSVVFLAYFYFLSVHLIRCETNKPKTDKYSTIHYLTGKRSSFHNNQTIGPHFFSLRINNSTKATFIQNDITQVVTHTQDELNPEVENRRDPWFKHRRNKPRRKRKGNTNNIRKALKRPDFAKANTNRRKRKNNALAKGLRKRKHHKKQKEPEKESSILEITTAKSRNQLVLDVNNSSLGILIEKLNQNPEMNYNHLISSFRIDEATKARSQFESQTHKTNVNTHLDNHKVQIVPNDANTNTFIVNDRDNQTNTDYISLLRTTTQATPAFPIKGVPLETSVNDLNHTSNELQILLLTNNRSNYNKCKKNRNGCAHICDEKDPNKCACLEGYYLAADGRNCLDQNECLYNNGGCERNCLNTLGSFYCGCPGGTRLADDGKSCKDVNECLLRNGHGPCQDNCRNTHGSYVCDCSGLKGTRLAADNHSCQDVNECMDDGAGCSHGCINALGRAFCTCAGGMALGSDWKTCEDINECINPDVRKSCQHGCINTLGSYRCAQSTSEQNDEETINAAPDHIVCPPLFPPTTGFYTCTRKKAASVKRRTRSGRLRVTNRPGTQCELVCPIHHKKIGDHTLICGVNGKWQGKQTGKCFPIRRHLARI